MSTTDERKLNNLKAGIFMSLAIMLAVVVMLSLSELNMRSTNDWRIEFDINEGIAGLSVGSPVSVGGFQEGRVIGIDFENSESNGQISHILVDIELNAEIALYSDPPPLVGRIAPLLGSQASLNFSTVGGDGEDKARLTPGAIIRAQPGTGMLPTMLGTKNSEHAQQIINNLVGFTNVLNQDFKKDYAKASGIVDDLSKLMATIRSDYGQWRSRIDNTLGSAESALAEFDTAGAETVGLIADARREVGKIGVILDDNTPRLNTTMENVVVMTEDGRELMNRIKSQTIEKIDRILDDGDRGITSFANIMQQAEETLDEQMPGIRQFLANARIASEQLKLTSIEIRRSPWKLMYQPSSRELSQEMLYEAARSFVMATEHLRFTSEAIESILDSRDDLVLDERTEQRLRDEILQSLDQYETAQQQLFNILIED